MPTTNIARTDDGTIQINFNIPKTLIDKAQEEALAELAKDITIAGFRKGNAPIDKVKEKIDGGKLLEKTLGKILPDLYTKALTENKIKPIIYPKFQILKQGDTNNGDDTWEIQAQTAELPVVELGDYKLAVAGAMRAASLKKEPTKEEKEQLIIKTLLEIIKVKLPKIIVDEEVNVRLSNLLERTEKLGLNFDTYLGSIGKTEQTLREEYEKQVNDGIAVELILNKTAEAENTQITDKEIQEVVNSSGQTKEMSEEQKYMITSVLKRRKVLDQLVTLS